MGGEYGLESYLPNHNALTVAVGAAIALLVASTAELKYIVPLLPFLTIATWYQASWVN